MKNFILFLVTVSLCNIHFNGNAQFKKGLYLEEYKLGSGLQFKSYSGKYDFGLIATLQPSFEFRSLSDFSNAKFRFRIRRARLELDGNAFNSKLYWRFKGDFALSTGNDPEELNNGAMLDAYVRYAPIPQFRITVGQRSLFTDNKELRMSSEYLNFVERSRLTSAFSAIRDMGVFIETRHAAKRLRVKTFWSVVTGDGANNFVKNYGGLKYGGRVNLYFNGYFRSFGEFRGHDMAHEWSPKFMLGLTGSYNDGQSSRRGRQAGTILYLDENMEESLPDYLKVGVDMLFKYRGLNILASGFKTWAFVPDDIVYRVRNDGSLSTSFTGGVENYVKGRMMLGTIFNAQAGYLFQKGFALDFAYTHLIPDENSFLNNNTFYNRNNYFTLGLTQYFKGAMKVQLQMIYNTHGEGATDFYGDDIPSDLGEFTTRLLFQIRF